MPELLRRSSSIYSTPPKPTRSSILDKKINLCGKELNVGIIIGIPLAIITIALHCVAYFTPHWKEISPKSHSLYVDGVDALIRTEILTYFHVVHQFTHHSYGLFRRCEYPLRNSSEIVHERGQTLDIAFNYQSKKCTKNFLPSYADDQFDACHSLAYYRFCSKTNGRIFDINHDYLRVAFNVLSDPRRNIDSTASCECEYPKYIKACQILGIMAIIFLSLTAILYGIFPFLTSQYQRLKIKCFAVLSSILAITFVLINLSVALSYFEYESLEYLSSIERHYRSSQIFKLSQDTKHAINQLKSNINIRAGYSTKIAWITLALSIVDAILLMLTCKVMVKDDDIAARFTSAVSYQSQRSDSIENERLQKSTDLQFPFPALEKCPSSPLPTILFTKSDEQSPLHKSLRPSCLKRSHTPSAHFEDDL